MLEGTGLGTLADVRSRLDGLPDGVYEVDEPHPQWWVRAGSDQWTVQLVPGLIESESPLWAQIAQRQVLLADSGAWATQCSAIEGYLQRHGVDYDVVLLPAGEKCKSLRVVEEVARQLAQLKVGGQDVVTVVGGGAAADVGRTAGALWRRGVACVCLPTTPLAGVDGAIGLKHFIDLELPDGTLKKNALGGYSPALVTLVDPDLFVTTPEEHVRSATAEIFKMGIVDRAVWDVLERDGLNLQKDAYSTALAVPILSKAIRLMLEALQVNTRERSKQRAVDFGHFVGKEIELLARPPLPHGLSVSVCMALMIVVAAFRGLLSWADAHRALNLMERLGLPIWHELLRPQVFRAAIDEVTLQRGGRQNVPVPSSRGVEFLQDVSVGELEEAADYIERRTRMVGDRG